MLTHSRDDDHEVPRRGGSRRTQQCAFFSLSRSPSVLYHPLASTRRRANSSYPLPSHPIVTDSALALRPSYQPFTGHGSGLMADGAIGFLQKRKRSSRKGAERAIGAAFVTLFVSFSPSSLSPSPVFLFGLPYTNSFPFAGGYTLTAGKRDLRATVGTYRRL